MRLACRIDGRVGTASTIVHSLAYPKSFPLMNHRSPSAERICTAALEHFAQRGYDGASLSEVAEAVGIRKASLYAHFKNKDALFLEALADAVAVEWQFALDCFAATETPSPEPLSSEQHGPERAIPGHAYCAALLERYAQSVHLRFLLRTAYGPPLALKPLIGQHYEPFIANIGELFAQSVSQQWLVTPLDAAQTRQYALAYGGIVESLYVELIYAGGTLLDARRQALWALMEDSLRWLSQRRQGQ